MLWGIFLQSKRKVPSNEYLRGELFVEDIKYLFEDAPQNLESLITADKTASFNLGR